MLQHINGTDRPNLNVYGSCGEPHRTAFTLYAFPRDLPIVKEQMQVIQEDRDEIAEVLLECEQFNLPADATLVPVYSHRYMVLWFRPQGISCPVDCWFGRDNLRTGFTKLPCS